MKTTSFYLFAFFLCFVSLKVQAQDNIVKSLERSEVGCGTVVIHQDARLNALLGVRLVNRAVADGETKVLKESGYRIQVYSGENSREGKNAAKELGEQVTSHYPELAVHVLFNSPRWLCQVGDYRTVEEAYAMVRKMKQLGMFNEAIVVKSEIIIPLYK